MKKRILFLVLILIETLILLTVKQAWAEKEANYPAKYDLGEIIVTATKTLEYQAETGSSTTVITAKDIKETGATTVGDLLRNVAGTTVVQSGAFGGVTSVYLRGANPGYTLVLIDGIEVNDPMSTDRSFDFAHLTLNNIERIEVVRGPQSTLYGSDAIGGVINIITKTGKGKPKFEISSEGDSYKTFRESIGLEGGTAKMNGSMSISRLNSSGISKASGGSEKDGCRNTTISSKIGYKIFGNSELNIITRFTDARTDLDDGAYDDDPNYAAWWRDLAAKVSLNQPVDRKSTRLNSSHTDISRMPSSA